MNKSAYIPSRGILRIPHLQNFLPEFRIQIHKKNAQTVIGWGLRPTARKARDYAARQGIPFIALEDGFLRSAGLGVNGCPPLALVVDDVGIYYDTTRPSRLEQLILAADGMPSEMLANAEKAIGLIAEHKLSKYNHAPMFSDGLPKSGVSSRPSEKNVVLVVDQTFGDMAVQYGGADEAVFGHMFQTALSENPDAEIWVKTHPDVLSGKKRGYLTGLSAEGGRVRLLAEDVNPPSLLARADKVYCVTSHMGFEALLLGKPVVTFGLPWYAGWGVSDDRHPNAAALAAQKRRAPRTTVQLFAAAYLQYSRYLNPVTGQAGTVFDVIDHLAAARRLNDKLRGNIYCAGMSWWKRAAVKPFFNLPSCRLHFVSSLKKLEARPLPPDARLLVWGNGRPEAFAFARKRNLPVLRMEDGFIRSVGLGSNLVPPLSLVIDGQGIYFNAQQPSELEHILQTRTFSQEEVQTAANVRQALTEAGISKYNVGAGTFTVPPAGRRVLLVPGQVEDDASILYGSPEIHTNTELLKTVREQNPDAYIIYKPHPDVVSGNRNGAVAPEDAARYANQTVTECSILTCLQHTDEVHTLTSLSGFEALLRGKTVHCYGRPFYAGWGLTRDHAPIARRTRRLTLNELVAGTLLCYPQYVHPETGRLMDVQTAIQVLRRQKEAAGAADLLHKSFFSKQLSKLKQLLLLLN